MITRQDLNTLQDITKYLAKNDAKYYKDFKDDNYKYIATKIVKLLNPLFPYQRYIPWMDLGFWLPVDPRTMIIGSNMYKSVVSTYQAFVGTPEDRKFNFIKETVSDLVSVWFTGIKYMYDGVNSGLWRVAPDNILQHSDETGTYRKEVIFFTESQYTSNLMNITKYALERVFFNWYNQVKLYQLDGMYQNSQVILVNNNNSMIGKEIPLNSINSTKNMQEIEKTGISWPAFVYLWHKEDGFHKQIESLVWGVDRNLTMIETTYMAHAEPWMVMKRINMPASAIDQTTWKIAMEKLNGRVYLSDDDNASIDFHSPTLDNLEKEAEHIEKLVRQIAGITNIPPKFFGLEERDGAVGAESRKMTLLVFFQQCQTYKDEIDDAFEELLGSPCVWEELNPLITSLLDNVTGNGNKGNDTVRNGKNISDKNPWTNEWGEEQNNKPN